MPSFVTRKSALLLLLAVPFLVAACATSGAPSFVAPPTTTPDPCSTQNLPATVKPLNDLMRQFDDYATLASSTPQSGLVQVIPPMQQIRRAAQDFPAPVCLQELRRLQLAYMDATIQTLLVFQSPDPSAGEIATGIMDARFYHDQYTGELVRVLGVTLIPPASPTAQISPTP